MDHSYSVGDRVRSVSDTNSSEGIIVAIIPCDIDAPRLDLYQIKFKFGILTLFGDQIELA